MYQACVTPLQVRVLDTIEERSEEARLISQQVCQDHLGHYQQAVMEPMDDITRDKAKVGSPRDCYIESDEASS